MGFGVLIRFGAQMGFGVLMEFRVLLIVGFGCLSGVRSLSKA